MVSIPKLSAIFRTETHHHRLTRRVAFLTSSGFVEIGGTFFRQGDVVIRLYGSSGPCVLRLRLDQAGGIHWLVLRIYRAL